MATTRTAPSEYSGASLSGTGSGIFPGFLFVSELQQRRQSAGIVSPTRVDLERHRDFPSLGGQLSGDGAQTNSNPYADGRARHIIRIDGTSLRLAVDLTWSPKAVLTDTVARLQRDLDEMKAESRYLRTPGTRDPLRQPRQVTFTSTKVPKFAGVTSWEQYRQVFDDATAALQLLSYLEGDALNVTLLVPESSRSSRVGLVGALSANYGSPGRLADYRRQFEWATRMSGEDPSGGGGGSGGREGSAARISSGGGGGGGGGGGVRCGDVPGRVC